MRHVKASKGGLAMVLGAVLALTACDTGSFIKNIDLSPAGTYQLKLIDNNQTMPYTTGAGNQQVTINAETMVMTEGGTWTLTTVRTKQSTGGPVTDTLSDGGTYTQDQENISLHSTVSNSTAFTGSFATNALVLNGADGHTYIFGT